MIISLVENFENIHQKDIKEMKLTLQNSDVPVDYIVGYPTYTFSDGSTISFKNNHIYSTSPRIIK